MNEILKNYLIQIDTLRKRERENANLADFIYIMDNSHNTSKF